MNLIEQFGGYEKAKSKLRDNGSLHAERLKKALLEYRRQHNIFETSDKVVLVGGGTTDVLLEIVYHKYTDDLYRACVLSTGSFGPIHKDNIRHATDAEIKAGKRLEVNQ